jgi:mono/diheme cytochrome c family protein
MARYLAGGDVGFEMPGLGIFYPPNITRDETGIGSWTEEQIIAAVRTGVRPDGRQLVPIMPYHQYAALTDEDAQALARFLKTGTNPVSNEVPDPVAPGGKAPSFYMTVIPPK